MKSIFTIAALLGTTACMVTNELIYQQPRRLDTTLLQFINDDESTLLQTDAEKGHRNKNYVGVRFIEQDDIKFNNELYNYNNITGLGNHGFLIKDYAPDYSGYERHIPGKEIVKDLVNILKGE